jgi:hypothetical protein
VQHAVIGILTMLKSIARSMTKENRWQRIWAMFAPGKDEGIFCSTS